MLAARTLFAVLCCVLASGQVFSGVDASTYGAVYIALPCCSSITYTLERNPRPGFSPLARKTHHRRHIQHSQPCAAASALPPLVPCWGYHARWGDRNGMCILSLQQAPYASALLVYENTRSYAQFPCYHLLHHLLYCLLVELISAQHEHGVQGGMSSCQQSAFGGVIHVGLLQQAKM